MSIFEILLNALFCFSMVFVFLGVLYVLVRLFTGLIRFIDPETKDKP